MEPPEADAVVLDPAAENALAALLRLDPDDAARIRDRTPARRRPRGRSGPSADYA